MKKIKVPLLVRVIIAISLGVLTGHFATAPVVRVFITFNALFSQFLQFLIPIIIVGLVTPAIAEIGKHAGKLLVITTLIAYGDTVFAGCLSYFTGVAIFPHLLDTASVVQIAQTQASEPYFKVEIPPLMGVMTALVLAFTVGLGIASLRKERLKMLCDEFKDIVSKTIESAIIPLLPIYIFGIFLDMTFTGQVAHVLTTFVSIIGVIFGLHILLLILQFTIAGLISRKNPFRLLWNMMSAYFTALGTSSSAATIPVTLKQTMKNGVSHGIAGFVIPLCATIHLSGSTLKIVACALALMIMQGMPYSMTLFIGFILMLGIVMVAAPGVPGGAIMAALGVLGSILGFGEQEQALMIALYIAMDSFGTACNVTGDGAIAVIMDSIFKQNISNEHQP